ncbi:glycosyltransferase family 4 protein [Negadavirga shengliensis]|uniref:Glycosyltransferase family 4 protein n=1 Tax=Negadavirga shengliensis TaxID=1389218 RepID=A0ABV9SVB9_9BACT
MKVLMFGWEFPPHISGGLGTACQGIVKGLIHHDVKVIMVVPKAHGDEGEGKFRLLSAENVPVTSSGLYAKKLKEKLSFFEINSPVLPYIHPEDYERYLKSLSSQLNPAYQKDPGAVSYRFSGKYGTGLMAEVWNYALVAGELARTNDFDIIHAHDWLSFPAAILVKSISNKPLIVHMHSTEFDRAGENVNQQIYRMERQAMESADQVIAVSGFTKQIIVDKYHIHPAKVVPIHNAVEQLQELPAKANRKFPREKIISYLGRVTFQKGPEYFIEAASKVLKKDNRFRFVMAGNGNLLNKMIEMTARLRISKRFHFPGFLKGSQVGRLLSMSDAYVMPSVSEPFGISPLEAMQRRIPSIISKQSGVQEILRNVIKVDFWNTDALANAIYGIGAYHGISSTLAAGGMMEVQSLDWNDQSLKMKNLYQQFVT